MTSTSGAKAVTRARSEVKRHSARAPTASWTGARIGLVERQVCEEGHAHPDVAPGARPQRAVSEAGSTAVRRIAD